MDVDGGKIFIKHIPSGLFSECSIRLHYIIEYLNTYKALPSEICSRNQFEFYKGNPDADIAKQLFTERDDVQISFRRRIPYNHSLQLRDYRVLPFQKLQPFIERYFTPFQIVDEREEALISQHEIDFSQTIGVIYRGNDKATEIRIAPYEVFFHKAQELLEHYPKARFLVQTDELEFRDEFCQRFSNSFYFETLPPIPRSPSGIIRPPVDNKIGFAIELLAAVRGLAKTMHLITSSGNLNMWTVLYRGHARNVYQFLHDRFLH